MKDSTAKTTTGATMGRLRKRLEGEIGQVSWRDLHAHAARGGLLLIEHPLLLIDAGLAIVQDEVKTVQAWMHSGLLRRPTIVELQAWKQNPELPFTSLIAQPFVIAKPLTAA